jgi:NACalpha-BTF3-like transcription factor
MKKMIRKMQIKMMNVENVARAVMTNNSGEGFIDSAVKILISIIIGSLLLAGLYALFGDLILPKLTERITQMFDFAG